MMKPDGNRKEFSGISASSFKVLCKRVFASTASNLPCPPPPCNSYALVIATVGVGTVLIWYLILIRYKCSAAA